MAMRTVRPGRVLAYQAVPTAAATTTTAAATAAHGAAGWRVVLRADAGTLGPGWRPGSGCSSGTAAVAGTGVADSGSCGGSVAPGGSTATRPPASGACLLYTSDAA